jgi:hypothetical protein
MKKILFLTTAVLFTIYFTTCKNDTITGGGSQVNETPTLSGKILNWNLGSGKKLIARAYGGDSGSVSVILDSSVIDSYGNFTIKLYYPPDSLWRAFSLTGTCTRHTVINPADLKFCYMYLFVEDSTRTYIGSLFRSNDSAYWANTGKTFCDLDCFNSSGSIMGTDTCTDGAFTRLIETSNVVQTKGWDSLYIIYDSAGINFARFTNTTQPQVVQWYLYRYAPGDRQLNFYQRKYLMKR